MKTTDDNGKRRDGAAVSMNRIGILVLVALSVIFHLPGVGAVYLRGVKEMLRILAKCF